MQRLAIALRKMEKANKAGLTLDKRPNSRALVFAHDEVSLPV